eukprot:8318289-Alexandrium_andersonii.AAC.1
MLHCASHVLPARCVGSNYGRPRETSEAVDPVAVGPHQARSSARGWAMLSCAWRLLNVAVSARYAVLIGRTVSAPTSDAK